MDEHEPSIDELEQSVIEGGIGWNYRIELDDTGTFGGRRAQRPAGGAAAAFAVTDTELSDYYERLAAQADPSADPSAPWDTWMLLMAPWSTDDLLCPGALGAPVTSDVGGVAGRVGRSA